MDLDQWIIRPRKRPTARLRLICLPYAGGAASAFASWARLLPEHVEMCAVQLPGRENRLSETPRTDLAGLVADLRQVVVGQLSDLPFVIFGHSMGTLIGFELARDLRRHNQPAPMRLIMSAHRAPQLPRTDPVVYNLPRSELIDEMRRMGGTPDAILDHAEMMDLLLPTLRADFEICDTYAFQPEPPLDVPISAIGGIDDEETSTSQLEAWQDQTCGSFDVKMFAGGHFFLKPSQEELLTWLAKELA